MENRLVSASGATTATLRYDPLGRLYEVAGIDAASLRFLKANHQGSIVAVTGNSGAVGNDPVNKADPTGTIITGPMPFYEIWGDPNKTVDEKIDTTANVVGVSADILAGGPSGEGIAIATAIKGGAKAALRESTRQSTEKSLNKGIKSLQKQIEKHIKKMEELEK